MVDFTSIVAAKAHRALSKLLRRLRFTPAKFFQPSPFSDPIDVTDIPQEKIDCELDEGHPLEEYEDPESD